MNKSTSILNVIVILSLLIPMSLGNVSNAIAQTIEPSYYRARVTIENASSRNQLIELGAIILKEDLDWALVLVSADQLKELARLSFQPKHIDELMELAKAHSGDKAWLASSLEPLYKQKPDQQTSETLVPASFSSQQLAALSVLTSVDSDGDGLSNTEELWWCTDPNNPNTDSDSEGFTDGEEVFAVLDFTLPRSVRWGYGPPFGPPAAWPLWNQVGGCNDGDWDTIPDYAEEYMVGSRVNDGESTDYDKFDDGQELFGVTYCPGAPVSCGYGNYPRQEYWNYIKAGMPNWVLPPGDNLFVAAFPIPEVSVVPGSWTVTRVTAITTEQGQMTQTTNSYETSMMEGQSSSIADTVTWNNWEEVSRSIEQPLDITLQNVNSPQDLSERIWGGVQIVGGAAVAVGSVFLAGALCSTGVGCIPGSAAIAAGGALAESIASEGWEDLTNPDDVQESKTINKYNTSNYYDSSSAYYDLSSSYEENNFVTINQRFNEQGILNALDGVHFAMNQQSELISRGLHDISYQLSRPRLTETQTSGHSWGGAQTTTHEAYEEHTITEGQAFTTGENWSTAWAVDSSHAADLTFNYEIKNTGTEYAREISNLIFSIYLGEDKEPLISYPAWEQFADGKLENVFPGSVSSFASNPVPLTLDQMKRIDLGDKLTVVLENFSYGADELFYKDAVDGGMTIFIEDSVEDGDELVDSYVIPTWGTETVQDVLTRYFPSSVDNNGNLNSLWTPEFDGINPPTWNEHFLSEIAWWNVYLTDPNAGNIPLHEVPAQASGAILFRFNRDSDRDGYQDRVEMKYGTDKDDPYSHPEPEVLAGYVSSRDGNDVTMLLKVANFGTFDAHGIDAMIYASDDSVTITGNTVGGNGRVRPGNQVAVGSLILKPDLSGWSNSTADPYATGNYTGSVDKMFTFSVNTPGVIGESTTSLSWSDGLGNSGNLDVGSNYYAPLPLDVFDGLEIGFNTGTVMAGESFTVKALSPRDTFSYTINREPYIEPVVVLSYSDPQGSRKFITPVELSSLEDDLVPYSGMMLPNVALKILTTGPVINNGTNQTYIVINNPHPEPILNAHIYINFVADGELMAELPYTLNLQPGPTVYPVNWSTSSFSQAYDSGKDNILVAFWTDSQDNIIDSAARPLNSFQADPLPKSASVTTDEIWDFGTARQGTMLQRQYYLGSVGFSDLLSYLEEVPGVTISNPAYEIFPGDMGVFTIALNTQFLPLGYFQEVLSVRTSDPADPERTITIQGEITAISEGEEGGHIIRPLDWPALIEGSHNQGEWVEFSHTLGPEPASLHPVKVFSQDYSTLWGVGKYATDFGEGTTPYDMFGDGRDGDLVISSNKVDDPIDSSCYGTSGTTTLYASNTLFKPGQKILIHQSRGTNAGAWEINQIYGFSSGIITTTTPLKNTYVDSGASQSQVLVLRQYKNVNIISGVTWFGKSWNGNVGGILAFLCQGNTSIYGNVELNGGSGYGTNTTGLGYGTGGGYYGGGVFRIGPGTSFQGEGTAGTGSQLNIANGNGAGGSTQDPANNAGGTGGSNGSFGTQGQLEHPESAIAGAPGLLSGNDTLTLMTFGGGGSGGSAENNNYGLFAGGGGAGGGIVMIKSENIQIAGKITANGGNGGNGVGASGGGGAGGSIFFVGNDLNLGTSLVSAYGGSGGTQGVAIGGAGGNGRIRIEYCETFTGYVFPSPSTAKLDCYIVEQLAISPYNITSLNLPESFTDGRIYQIQYGRRQIFESAGQQTTFLRIPKQIYSNANLQALISGTEVPSASLLFQIDIGDDADYDWIHNQVTEFPAELEITNIVTSLNDYLISRTDIPWGQDVDVPIKVDINSKANVLLTNLVLLPQAESIRYIRLHAQEYSDLHFSMELSQIGMLPSESITLGIDVGGDGNMDWSYAGDQTVPAVIETSNLASAFNTYLFGLNGDVDVPILIFSNQPLVILKEYTAVPANLPDPTLSSGDISFGAEIITEGEIVSVEAQIHNISGSASGPVSVSFFAGIPNWGDWYIGSDFLSNIPAGGSASVEINWDSLGFNGLVPVKVIIDPLDRVDEIYESNNQAIKNITILSRPDLIVSGIDLSEAIRLAIPNNVEIEISNDGGTGVFNQVVSLYAGNPESGGYLIGSAATAVQANSSASVTIPWMPSQLGSVNLFAVVDSQKTVDESNETNNISSTEKFVGWGNPVYIDVAGSPDPIYDSSTGYGYLTPGTPITSCGTEPYQTYRQVASDQQLKYQIDYLLPERYYHLDLTFFLCSGSRELRVLVDNVEVASEIIATTTANTISILLDPSLYADNTITIAIEKTGGDLGGPVLSEIKLTDIRYCYRDSGIQDEVSYADSSDGCGWLDGIGDRSWGTLPYQSVRYDDDGNVQYQFDGMEVGKDYRLNATFFEMDSTGRVQDILIDGVPVQTGVVLSSTPQIFNIDIPEAAYQDGSVIVTIQHAYQPVISEISLEEKTAMTSGIEPPAIADISVQVTDNPDPVIVGETLTYTVLISNAGPQIASQVTLLDYLPPGLTLISTTPSQGSGCTGEETITCELGNINVGESATVQINALVNGLETSTLTNHVTVTGIVSDNNLTNNSASQETTVVTTVNYQIFLPLTIK